MAKDTNKSPASTPGATTKVETQNAPLVKPDGSVPETHLKRLMLIRSRTAPAAEKAKATGGQKMTVETQSNTPELQALLLRLRSVYQGVNTRSSKAATQIVDPQLKALMAATDQAHIAENARRDQLVADAKLVDIAGAPVTSFDQLDATYRDVMSLVDAGKADGAKAQKKTVTIVPVEQQAAILAHGIVQSAIRGQNPREALADAPSDVLALLQADDDVQFALALGDARWAHANAKQ